MESAKRVSSRARGAVAAAVALGTLAALSVLAGASWATGSSNAGQYQYGSKVTICHHTHSKKNPWVTITVSKAAWDHHFSKTGDTLGTCASSNKGKKPKTTATTNTTTTSSSTGHGNGHGKGSEHGKGH